MARFGSVQAARFASEWAAHFRPVRPAHFVGIRTVGIGYPTKWSSLRRPDRPQNILIRSRSLRNPDRDHPGTLLVITQEP